MTAPYHDSAHFPPGIKVFRTVMQEFHDNCDGHWTSAGDETLHFYEQLYRSQVRLSVWVVRAPSKDRAGRGAVIRCWEPFLRQGVIEILDGDDMGWLGGAVQPIGQSLEELHLEILRRLLHAWSEMEEIPMVATIEDSKGEIRQIDDKELRDILLDCSKMRRYYEDYTARTAMKIAKALPLAKSTHNSGGGRWGPGKVARLIDIASSTTSRYLKAFWMAGIREIEGAAIPYGPKKPIS